MEYLLRPETSRFIRCLKELGGSVKFKISDHSGLPLDFSKMPDYSLAIYEDLKQHMATNHSPQISIRGTVIQNGGTKTSGIGESLGMILETLLPQIEKYPNHQRKMLAVVNILRGRKLGSPSADHLELSLQDLIYKWEQDTENTRLYGDVKGNYQRFKAKRQTYHAKMRGPD
jgi:hypothetical protein